MAPPHGHDPHAGYGNDPYEDEFVDDLDDDDGEPMVRPFMITGGRTDTNLPIEAMVVDAAAGRARLPAADEYHRVYRLCASPLAVAELSAHVGLPLGVVRVLVGDLVDSGALVLAEQGSTGLDELDFIDRIIMAVEAL